MGRTRYSGPVYGAKQTLWSVSRDTLSTGAGNGVSTSAGACIVPVGEDWYACEFHTYRGSTGSTATGFWLKDDSTVVSSVTVTSSLAEQTNVTIITADGGEKEGTRLVSGSTLTFGFTNSSAQGALTNVQWSLSGYRRYVTSSRAE